MLAGQGRESGEQVNHDHERRLEQGPGRRDEEHGRKRHALDSATVKCLVGRECKKVGLEHTGALGCPWA
jgi:hypothetical protein